MLLRLRLMFGMSNVCFCCCASFSWKEFLLVFHEEELSMLLHVVMLVCWCCSFLVLLVLMLLMVLLRPLFVELWVVARIWRGVHVEMVLRVGAMMLAVSMV